MESFFLWFVRFIQFSIVNMGFHCFWPHRRINAMPLSIRHGWEISEGKIWRTFQPWPTGVQLWGLPMALAKRVPPKFDGWDFLPQLPSSTWLSYKLCILLYLIVSLWYPHFSTYVFFSCMLDYCISPWNIPIIATYSYMNCLYTPWYPYVYYINIPSKIFRFCLSWTNSMVHPTGAGKCLNWTDPN